MCCWPMCILFFVLVCSLLEQKVDQLTKMMAELTRRLQGVEGRGATHGMGAY